MRSRQEFLNDFGMAWGLAMGVSAVVGALFGSLPGPALPVGVALGALALHSLRSAGPHPGRTSSTTVPSPDGTSNVSACLILSALLPPVLPLLVRGVEGAATYGGSAAVITLIGVLLGAASAALARRFPPGVCRLTPRSALLGGLLIPLGVGSVLPAVGLVETGLLVLPGWALAAWANRGGAPTEDAPSAPPAAAGIVAGLGLVAVGPIHLANVPWLSPDPFVLAALLAAVVAGAGIGRAVGSRPLLGAGLVTLGVAVGAELPPQLPDIALSLLSSRSADDPALAYALPVVAAALPGALLGLGVGLVGGRGRAVSLGAIAGLALWQLGPGVLGADGATHLLAGVLALASLPLAVSADRVGARLAGVALPVVAAASALLPAPDATSLPADEAWRRLGSAAELTIGQKRAAAVTIEEAAGPRGRTLLLRRGDVPWSWQRGGLSSRFDDSSRFADRFLGHLPALVGEEPARAILIEGLGSGQTADAARQSSPGQVVVVEPDPAVRAIARRHLPAVTGLLADPAVRVRTISPSAPEGGWDAVIVDVPRPWRFGAGAPIAAARLRRIRDSLSSDGVAVIRLPLASLSPNELATFGARAARIFPSVLAWLDPVDARNLVLTAWPTERSLSAATLKQAWQRETLRSDLRDAGLPEPADLLERLLTDRQGLALLGAEGRDAAGTAVVAAARARRGKTTLPLSQLEGAGRPVASMVSLDGLPPEDRASLDARLDAADASRGSYLSLLSLLAGGKTKEAIALATQLGETSTNPARDLRSLVAPWLRRGTALRREGKFAQAEAELSTAFAFSPTDVDVNLELARVLLAQDRATEAVSHVERARTAEPGSVEPVLLLADVHVAKGALAEAADVLTDAEPLFPTDVRLLVNLGYVLTQLSVGSDETIASRLARARVLFQRAASLAPRAPQPRAGLAEVYYRQGDGASALREIDRALIIAPTCEYRSIRGHVLGSLERLDEARGALEAAIMDCPTLLEALVYLGAVRAEQGNPSGARELWERALEVDPTNAAARENLAILEASKFEEFIEQGGGGR